MRKVVLFTILLIGFIGCGCASTPFTPPTFNNQREFQQSYDATWTCLMRVMAEKDYDFKIVEKDSGIITTEWMGLPNPGSNGNSQEFRKYAVIQTWFPALWGAARVFVKIYVIKNGEELTTVKVTTTMQALENNISKTGQWYECYSTGNIETNILNGLSECLR